MDTAFHNLDLIDALMQLPCNVYLVDKNGITLNCNQHVVEYLQLSSVEDVIGKSHQELYAKENADRFDATLNQVVETGKAVSIQEFIQLSDGKTYCFHSCKAPLRNFDGEIIGVLGITVNLTEDKTEIAFLKKIIELLPGHVWWIDRTGRMLACNDLLAQHSNFKKAEDMLGKTTIEMLPPEMTEEEKQQAFKSIREADERIMSTEVPFIGEETIHIHGEQKTYFSAKRPIKDLDGEVTGLIGIAQDITELKAAQEKAEYASQVKSEFIENMSHDFRTPITGMLGEAEYIEQHAKDHNIRESGRFLKEGAKQLLRLANDILDFVSLDNQNFCEPEIVFDPAEMVKQVIALMRVSLKHKSLDIDVEINPNVPKAVRGYGKYFERIVNNLVGNAIKFTPEGSVKVCLRAEDQTSHEVALILAVEDTGIGIPSNKFNEIFEQFYKISASHKGLYDGSGLGLFAVKQYLSKMQGHIDVESIVGKGSTFIATIPFEKAVSAETVTIDFTKSRAQTEEPVKNQNDSVVIQLHPGQDILARVLVVEDSPLPARAVIRLLHEYNCEVKLVKTGEEAVKAALKRRYDLILMDIGLPKMNGIEATRQIRALPAHNDVPIIALTGHIRGDKKPECLEAGMQEVYSKPLTRHQLKSMMDKYVDTHKSEGKYAMKTPFASHVLDINAMMEQFLTEDPAQLIDMFEVALDYLPQEMKRLQTAVAKQDLDTIKACVHSLKGGVAYLAAPDCSELITNWDNILRTEQPTQPSLDSMLQQIEQSLNQLCEAMQQAIDLIKENKED